MPLDLLALQPYWLRSARRGRLSAEDRQALASNTTPPSLVRTHQRGAVLTARIGGSVLVALFLVAAGGAVMVTAGPHDPEGRGWLLVFGAGALLPLALPITISAALRARRQIATPLQRVTDTVIDVRKTTRLGFSSHERPIPIPYELQLASGLVIELPVTSGKLVTALRPGSPYRIWYVPAIGAEVPPQLVYIDYG